MDRPDRRGRMRVVHRSSFPENLPDPPTDCGILDHGCHSGVGQNPQIPQEMEALGQGGLLGIVRLT